MGRYWDETGIYNEIANQLNDLMPGMGKCETHRGEIWRAATKIYHDYYNNGFGNFWEKPAAFLMDHVELPTDVKDVLLDYANGNIAYSNCEEEMEEMIDTVIETLMETEDRPNTIDMWEYNNPNKWDFAPEEWDEEDEEDFEDA